MEQEIKITPQKVLLNKDVRELILEFTSMNIGYIEHFQDSVKRKCRTEIETFRELIKTNLCSSDTIQQSFIDLIDDILEFDEFIKPRSDESLKIIGDLTNNNYTKFNPISLFCEITRKSEREMSTRRSIESLKRILTDIHSFYSKNFSLLPRENKTNYSPVSYLYCPEDSECVLNCGFLVKDFKRFEEYSPFIIIARTMSDYFCGDFTKIHKHNTDYIFID